MRTWIAVLALCVTTAMQGTTNQVQSPLTLAKFSSEIKEIVSSRLEGKIQCICATNTTIDWFTGTQWNILFDGSGTQQTISNMTGNCSQSSPKLVAGFKKPGGVKYYNGTAWEKLMGDGWGEDIEQLSADLSAARPRVVAALHGGAIKYYDGKHWRELEQTGWNQKINQMSVDFSQHTPRIVVALNSGGIHYFDGNYWHVLHGSGWGAALQLAVNWTSHVPDVAVGMDNGNVQIYNESKWHAFRGNTTGHPISQMSVDWSLGMPRIVVGLGIKSNTDGGGGVEYYDGYSWSELKNNAMNAPVSFLSAVWYTTGPDLVIGNGPHYWKQSSSSMNANSSLARVSLYKSGAWKDLGTWYNPVSAMNVNWTLEYPPSILFALGPNKAFMEAYNNPGPNAYQLLWNGR